MEIKTIKDVDEETWREFKIMAARADVKMSILFKMMLKEFEKSRKFWDEILTGKKVLSDIDAKKFEAVITGLRKERGFREWS